MLPILQLQIQTPLVAIVAARSQRPLLEVDRYRFPPQELGLLTSRADGETDLSYGPSRSDLKRYRKWVPLTYRFRGKHGF